VTVSAPTTAFLTFSSNTPGNVGTLLDNVTLTSRRAAVPEPGTMGLAALGLLALGVRRKRG
jgi:PEP-CTERM motif